MNKNESLQQARRLLILAPHPDDEAIACGGLIASAVRQGWEVLAVICAIGECRQLGTGFTESRTRNAELVAAATFGGYQSRVLLQGEAFMRLDGLPRKQLCDLFEDEIGRFKPDVVVIPPASSYDQDHRAVAEAAMTAMRPRPADMRFTVRTVLESDEPYWWRVDGTRPNPNLFVRLQPCDLEAKFGMIRCHASQDRPDPFGRSCENLERLSRSYGIEIGGGLAEAYRILRTDGSALGLA